MSMCDCEPRLYPQRSQRPWDLGLCQELRLQSMDLNRCKSALKKMLGSHGLGTGFVHGHWGWIHAAQQNSAWTQEAGADVQNPAVKRGCGLEGQKIRTIGALGFRAVGCH